MKAKTNGIAAGQFFGLWTVIERAADRRNLGAYWRCRCECGSEREVRGYYLLAGTSRSCSSKHWEQPPSQLTHGAHGTPEWEAWSAAIKRCENPAHAAFKNYGARGIRMCDEWRHDFAAFLAHVGSRPTPQHSIDRINNDRGYEPGNCRWATKSEQRRNQRKHLSRPILVGVVSTESGVDAALNGPIPSVR